jgi:hypothetical protein
LKQVIYNALDACEEADIAPVIEVISDDVITVADNGPGIAPDTVAARVSSREAYVSPTRFAQGNALDEAIAAHADDVEANFQMTSKLGSASISPRSLKRIGKMPFGSGIGMKRKGLALRSGGPNGRWFCAAHRGQDRTGNLANE